MPAPILMILLLPHNWDLVTQHFSIIWFAPSRPVPLQHCSHHCHVHGGMLRLLRALPAYLDYLALQFLTPVYFYCLLLLLFSFREPLLLPYCLPTLTVYYNLHAFVHNACPDPCHIHPRLLGLPVNCKGFPDPLVHKDLSILCFHSPCSTDPLFRWHNPILPDGSYWGYFLTALLCNAWVIM